MYHFLEVPGIQWPWPLTIKLKISKLLAPDLENVCLCINFSFSTPFVFNWWAYTKQGVGTLCHLDVLPQDASPTEKCRWWRVSSSSFPLPHHLHCSTVFTIVCNFSVAKYPDKCKNLNVAYHIISKQASHDFEVLSKVSKIND